MKLCLLTALNLVATASAFGIARPVPSSSTALGMSAIGGITPPGGFTRDADILSTLGTLEGPSICYGPEGTLINRPELEIKEYDNFDFFKNAIDQAGLTKLLRGVGPYTILAPTNTAIEVFQGVLTEDVLKYHILIGDIYSDELNGKLETLNGEFVTCRFEFRKTYVDDAFIGQKDNHTNGTPYPTDVICENGVIHAIKLVLTPGYTKAGAEDQIVGRRRPEPNPAS